MKTYCVLGLGKFGVSLSKTLIELGHEVLGVDSDEKIVQHCDSFLTSCMQADVTNEDFLRTLGIRNFTAAIVAIGDNMQASILSTVLVKELGARYVVAKAQDDFHAKVLLKVGADKVILPEKDMGIKAAHNLASGNFFDIMELSGDYGIISIPTPESWCGKSLGTLAVRTKYSTNVIAVKTGNRMNVLPDASSVLNHGDTLTMIGANSALRRIEELD